MIGCSVAKKVGSLDAAFQVRRTETCLAGVEEAGGRDEPISGGCRNRICRHIVSSSRTVSSLRIIGLLQVPSSSDAHPGPGHLILVLEFSRSQEQRFE